MPNQAGLSLEHAHAGPARGRFRRTTPAMAIALISLGGSLVASAGRATAEPQQDHTLQLCRKQDRPPKQRVPAAVALGPPDARTVTGQWRLDHGFRSCSWNGRKKITFYCLSFTVLRIVGDRGKGRKFPCTALTRTVQPEDYGFLRGPYHLHLHGGSTTAYLRLDSGRVTPSTPSPPARPAPRTPSPSARYWVDTFANATGYLFADCGQDNPSQTRCRPQGTLFAARNYVFCKLPGARVGTASEFNHYWLLTDLDALAFQGAQRRAYVSAYYLKRWGNDVANDNDGRPIPHC